LRELDDWLDSETGPRSLLVTAPAGRGKTALLVQWIARLEHDRPVAFIPISIRAETNRAADFYQALALRLGQIAGKPISAIPVGDPALFYRSRIIDLLEEIPKAGARCVIVVDGLDEAVGWSVDPRVLPARPGNGIKIVASARLLAGDADERDWLSRLRWLEQRQHVRSMSVQPLDRDGVADVLKKMALPLDRLGADVDIVAQLHRLTEGGDPLLLTLYVEDLLGRGDAAADLRPEDLTALKPGYGFYFDRWFEHLDQAWEREGDRFDANLIDAVMVVLACALGPLPLATLEEVLDRIAPGHAIISEKTLRPIRRFVFGDGSGSGYVLSHPKLADYLREERFAGGSIVARTRREFALWGHEVAQALNERRRDPASAPRYALLHHTQHLAQLDRAEAVALFPAVLGKGWFLARRNSDAGKDGYARDVTLALRAMQRAQQDDPSILRARDIGLGGQIRCMLILSSVRSAGLRMPSALIGEFLARRLITPREAISLVRFKESGERGEGIEAITPYLPGEMLPEALALAYEVPDLRARSKALRAIAQKCTPRQREQVFANLTRAARAHAGADRAFVLGDVAVDTRNGALLGEALEAATAEGDDTWRGLALDHVANAAGTLFDTATASDWRRRVGEAKSRPPAPAPAGSVPREHRSSSAPSVSDPRGITLDRLNALRNDVMDPDRDAEGVAARLVAAIADADVDALAIKWAVDALFDGGTGSRASALGVGETALRRMLDAALHEQSWLRQLFVLRGLIPHLTPPLRSHLLHALCTRVPLEQYVRKTVLEELGPSLPAAAVESALDTLMTLPERYDRSRAIGALLTALPDDRIAERALSLLDRPGHVDLEHILSSVSTRLTEGVLDSAIAAAVSLPESAAKDLLVAIAPGLSDAQLPVAVAAARGISDQATRGAVLLAVLTRWSALNGSGPLDGLQDAAFLINDGDESTFLLAAVHRFLPEPLRADVRMQVVRRAKLFHGMGSDENLLAAVASLALVAGDGHDEEARSLLLDGLAGVRTRAVSGLALLAELLLASHLPTQTATEAFDAVFTRLDQSRIDEGPVLRVTGAAIAPTRAAAERTSQDAQADPAPTSAFAHLARALTATGIADTITHMEAACSAAHAESDGDRGQTWSFVALVAVVLQRVLPAGSARAWFMSSLAAKGENGPEDDVLSLLSPWASDEELASFVADLGTRASETPRSEMLMSLSMLTDPLGELLRVNPRFRDAPFRAPLVRLGGENAAVEAAKAVRDVTAWWP
jgi:hypothetical protein